MADLHMTLWHFYECTPIEIDYALKAYNEKVKSDWERTRLHIFYGYIISTGDKVNYEEFKKRYMPFSFDKDYVDDTPVMDEETFDTIINIFNKKKEGTE